MRHSTTALTVIALTAALAACNRPDPNRTTQAPPGVNSPTAVMQPLVTPSAPPAPAERGPVAPSANTAAPGTDATVAFANERSWLRTRHRRRVPRVRSTQAVAVDAQQAAAKAPDTASADAAKAEAKEGATGAVRTPGTGTDTSANSPRHGTLTKEEESKQMPKAGQANNHSSPALENDSGRGPNHESPAAQRGTRRRRTGGRVALPPIQSQRAPSRHRLPLETWENEGGALPDSRPSTLERQASVGSSLVIADCG